jgi:hypothetical protein
MKHIKPASVILLGLVSLTAACQQKPVEAPKTAATMTEDQKAIYAYGAAIGQQLAEQNKQLRLSPEELEVFRTAFGDTVGEDRGVRDQVPRAGAGTHRRQCRGRQKVR